MPDLTSLEKRLAALAPPQISQHGQNSIDALLDDLAADVVSETPSSEPSRLRWGSFAAAGAAALIVTSAVLISSETRDEVASISPDLNLVALSDVPSVVRIEEKIQDGTVLHDEADWPVESTRYRIVTEHKVVDKVSGLVFTISQPSEEILLSQQQLF